jgi:hypothetical protein
MVETLFFCFGAAKSGTTLLQHCLNMHPEVSCPAEHQFDRLRKDMLDLFNNYNKILNIVDRRTDSQGATQISQEGFNRILHHTIIEIVDQSATGKPIGGINDNGILFNLEYYNSLFDRPKMIVIFRSPMATGISAWHHNLRLAEEENEPSHIKFMERHGGDFEGWMVFHAEIFDKAARACQAFSADQGDLLTLRYEDLIANKKQELVKIFGHLGARITDKILDNIVHFTYFDRMRKNSKNPGFFRSGKGDEVPEELTEETKEKMYEVARESMEAMGYLGAKPQLSGNLPIPK